MIDKTNAMRLLEQAGIACEVRRYTLGGDDLSAERVAQALGVEPERIFKTLVLRGNRSGTLIALAPAGTTLDLRAMARASGDKRVDMVPQREVRALTGHVRGEVTPVGLPRAYPIWIDETASLWDRIGISGGAQGVELFLKPKDLLRLTGARVADIARSV